MIDTSPRVTRRVRANNSATGREIVREIRNANDVAKNNTVNSARIALERSSYKCLSTDFGVRER